MLEVKKWLWAVYARVYPVVETSYPYKEMMIKISRLIPPGSSVVDIGCGTGGLIPYLEDVKAYTGIEAEPEMLEAARRRAANEWNLGIAPRAEFMQGTVMGDEEWPEADVYVLCNVFYTLEHKQSVLNALYKRMPSGSRLILCDPDGMPDIMAVLHEHWRKYRSFNGAWALRKHQLKIAPKLAAIVLLNGLIFQEFQFVPASWQKEMLRKAGFMIYITSLVYSDQNSLIDARVC